MSKKLVYFLAALESQILAWILSDKGSKILVPFNISIWISCKECVHQEYLISVVIIVFTEADSQMVDWTIWNKASKNSLSFSIFPLNLRGQFLQFSHILNGLLNRTGIPDAGMDHLKQLFSTVTSFQKIFLDFYDCKISNTGLDTLSQGLQQIDNLKDFSLKISSK